MAVHHNDAEVLLAGQEALADAKLVVLRLTGECHARSDAGVHEQVVAVTMVDRQRL